jgi:hypothetical protein
MALEGTGQERTQRAEEGRHLRRDAFWDEERRKYCNVKKCFRNIMREKKNRTLNRKQIEASIKRAFLLLIFLTH